MMNLEIEVWLRGNDFATTDVVPASIGDPSGWTDDDVRVVLEELLRAIDRGKDPDADRQRPIWLRGFNWIVSPHESGGVLLAVEIQLGASAAGPFAIEKDRLEDAITRVIRDDRADGATRPAMLH